MTDSELGELRDLSERLAREGGDIALRGRRLASAIDADTKSSVTDVVTRYDRAAEEHIVGEIRRLRPDDAIVGEEGTDDAGTTGLAWHIDPIDGTTNFVYDQPAWCCSVAVASDQVTLAGAVAVPRLGETYVASLGGGATCNGSPIGPSRCDELALALVGTGFSYDARKRTAQGAIAAGLLGHVRDIRRLGSAAFDLCMVACGRLDVYYEQHLNSWDMAAGELIAREAGCSSSNFGGGVPSPAELVVSTPAIHDAFLAAVAALAATAEPHDA